MLGKFISLAQIRIDGMHSIVQVGWERKALCVEYLVPAVEMSGNLSHTTLIAPHLMQASSADSDAKYSRTMYKCVNSDYLEAEQYLDTTRCHGNAAIRLRQLNTTLSKTPDDPGTLLFSLNTCADVFDWTLNSTTFSCIVICPRWEPEGARGLAIHGGAANWNALRGSMKRGDFP